MPPTTLRCLVSVAVAFIWSISTSCAPPADDVQAATHEGLPSLNVSQDVCESLRRIGPKYDELLHIDGSTSCQPLVALIRGVALDAQWEWLPGGENTVNLEPRLARKLGGHTQTHGTGASYLNLANGKTHLALVAREPSPQEIALAAEHGHTFDVRPVARDAFVFLVNDTNPVDGLTIAQIRDIYGGSIHNWNQVGGPDLQVIAAGRDRGSGSLELMEKLVMKGHPTRLDAAYRIVAGMAFLPIEVEHNAGAIGYTVHYYNRYMFSGEAPPPTSSDGRSPGNGLPPSRFKQAVPVGGRKVIAVDGTLPTPSSIADNSYPLVEPVYVVIREQESADSKFRALRDWLLSPDGQALVASTGYVPLQTKNRPPTTAADR